VQRLDCRDVLYILAMIIQVQIAVTRRDSFNEISIKSYTIIYELYMTDVMINADYIEPRQFLEDAGVVLERVRNVIERHNDVKVNTVFNGEFVAGDERAKIKSSIRETMNSSKYRICMNGHEHHVEPTLAALEEFQERDNGWDCRESSIL